MQVRKKRPKKQGKTKATAQNSYSGPLGGRKLKYLSEDQIHALFRVISSNRDKAMFRLAFLKGLRASEVGLIRLDDLREREGRVYVRRLKNSRSGEFRLHRQEATFLRAWLRERGRSAGALFRSRNNRAISRRQLDRLMKTYGAAAGLPRELCHFHVLKHSRGTQLLASTHDVTLVQDQLGHRNIQNTMIYAEVVNPTRDALFEKEKERW
jgi:site-specific recombinase XerC